MCWRINRALSIILVCVCCDTCHQTSISCKIFNITTLDCGYRNLTEVPLIDKSASVVRFLQNKIRAISPTAFVGQSQITSIDFSLNRLKNITGSPFLYLKALKFLNVSFNQISVLSSSSFQGLAELRTLDIAFNQLTILPDDVFADLVLLNLLLLHSNLLTTIPGKSLSLLHNLEYLYLAWNPYTSLTIGPEFKALVKLRFLHFSSSLFTDTVKIGNNPFQYLESTALESFIFWSPADVVAKMGWFEKLRNIAAIETGVIENFNQTRLQSTNVWGLDLLLFPINFIITKELFKPFCNLNSNITTLILGESYIRAVEGSSFTCFPFLKALDLSAQAVSFDTVSDSAFNGLNNLEILSLGRNAFKYIPSESFVPFARTGSLKLLDMSYNKLNGLFADDTFISVTSLTDLDLSYNPLTIIKPWINVLQNLSFLNIAGSISKHMYVSYESIPLKSVTTFFLNNPSYCDILKNTYDISKFLILGRKMPNLAHLNLASVRLYNLNTIQNLTLLQSLDVSGSFKTGNLIEQFNTLYFPNLVVLKLAQNRLQSMAQLALHKTTPNLTHLDLSDNSITSIDPKIKHLFLQILKLNDNSITSIDTIVDNLRHMRTLELANNVLNIIPAPFVDALLQSNLETLNIVSNPLACTCEIKSFQVWIVSDNRVYVKPDTNICKSPAKYKGLSLTQVEIDCTSYLWMYITVCIIGSIIMCFVSILFWRYRWYLRYKVYLARNWHRIYYNGMDGEFEMVDIPYDAFVSYAHDCDRDLHWVLNDLRPNLEEGPEPVRLCIGQARDFVPGSNLFDSITDAIHQSRKTIVVLSPRYVDSELCYFEAQHAWMRLLEENRDVLVLILLEPIPDDKMTRWLRKLLCKKTYLRWPCEKAEQQLFWRCVREKLKKRTLVNRQYDA